jgi:hypothetical protein
MRRTALWITLACLSAGLGGCTFGSDASVDLEKARSFDAYPLYWVGEEFEGLKLTNVATGGVGASFTYGTCEITGDHGCAAPLQIQVFPLCFHSSLVSPDGIWTRRQIRGAPVGAADGAPLMFTRHIEIKVYRGQGSDPGLPLRALHALRSFNDVPPRIGPSGAIPPPQPGVLEGEAPCPG